MKKDRLVSCFLELVRIDSPSGQEGDVAAYIRARLAELGIATTADSLGNVHGWVDGVGEPIILNAHMDTVPPCMGIKPILKDGVISSDGTTVLGADDKSGVAAILETLRTLKEEGTKHPPLELVFSVQEETGLTGAKNLDFKVLRAKQALVLDSGGGVGNIITAAPGSNIINASVFGRAAHAGVAPEKGINAIYVAAQAIARMKVGRIDEETTANVGTIRGGAARNIVPERVDILAEARSRSEEKLRRQTDEMTELLEEAARSNGARTEINVQRAYTAYHVPDDDPLVQDLMRACRSLGIEPQTRPTGGGSDANVFNLNGIKAVALATGYEDNHATTEHIAVGDLAKATELLIALLRADEG